MKNSLIVVLRTLALVCFLASSQTLLSDEFRQNAKGLKDSEKFGKYIENTTWIVPPSTLLAYEYINGASVKVSDQTVWVITKFDQGYFFGNSYTGLNGSPSATKAIVGSITPFGDVYISFFPVTGNYQNTDVVTGIGKFTKHKGKPYFVMQMNTGENGLQGLAHWSYMISVKPDDYFYQHLPSMNMSVPEFIAQF